jgi:hypothetical protein
MKMLTSAEVAAIRRRTPQALVMERKRGQGPPYVRDSGRVLYPEDDLLDWLDDHRVVPNNRFVGERRRARDC